MHDYLQFFLRHAQTHAISLKPIMAFALLEDTDVPIIAHSVLTTLASVANESVKTEAQTHLDLINKIISTRQETRQLNLTRTKETLKLLQTAPDSIRRLILKSTITEEDVGEHHDMFLNCVYFLSDKESTKHPIFKRIRGGGGSSSSHSNKKTYNDEDLEKLWKKENPRLYYSDKIFIGKGGFGEVYIAQRKKDGTRVAMKVLKRKLEEDTHHIIKEIEVMRDCKHENIVNFEECYLYEGTISVVMEYCDGGTLRDLCREVFLNEQEIAHFCRQILEGLEYLHLKLNRIHRDIKSDNILLNLNGDIRIADLGLVESEDKTRRLSMVGTSYWMAPEIIAQQHYGMSVDIWALGCVCFELCTGEPPYHDLGSLKAMFFTSTRGAPILPHNPERQFTPVLHDFLDWCFQFNPQLRPLTTRLLTHPLINNTEPANLKVLQNKLELVFIGSSLKMNGLL
jgi:hypothetical protein